MKKDLEKLKAYLDPESQTETKFDLYPFLCYDSGYHYNRKGYFQWEKNLRI